MTQHNDFKLGQVHPHAKEMLAISYLLSIICVTLQGSQVGGGGNFFCVAPTLEEYLEQGDEKNL